MLVVLQKEQYFHKDHNCSVGSFRFRYDFDAKEVPPPKECPESIISFVGIYTPNYYFINGVFKTI